MSVKITTRQVGEVMVVDAVGRITVGQAAGTFRETLLELASQNQKKILLNLQEVSYMDSSGIGYLVVGLTTAVNSGGSLKLLNPQKRIMDLLKFTKLIRVFEVHKDEAGAIRSFQ